MVRILGVDIPDNKNIEVSLTYLYGIGPFLAKKILEETKINSQKKAKELTSTEINAIKEYLEKNKIKIEGELRQEIKANIKRLIDINAYRGIRHIRRLPVRGQRTKTNSRTVRGNVRKTVGSGRRKAASPT
ncbi:MAG: small subunit ribosomal protein [Patescibacteria group bacterium]|nr:small subunit ribosomal protein [Patescibacteria group bacterium]